MLGFLLSRLGYRWTLVLGGIAYTLRFAVFALGTPETKALVAAANALHGLCYGCFFAGAFLYVERVAPEDVRHSAQTVFGIIILGLGPVLAGLYNDEILGLFEPPDGPIDYARIWWVQTAIAAVTTLFVAICFRPRETVER